MSVTCGFITGNRILHIFSIAGIGALIFGGMGFGIYAIFEKKVPEFLDFLSELGGGMGFRRSSSDPYSVGGDFSSDGEIFFAGHRKPGTCFDSGIIGYYHA